MRKEEDMDSKQKQIQRHETSGKHSREYDPEELGYGPGRPMRSFGGTYYPSGSPELVQAALKPTEVESKDGRKAGND